MHRDPFSSRTYKIANRILPISQPSIVGMDGTDLGLGFSETYQIVVPFILPPLISSNLAFSIPDSFEPPALLAPVESEGLTDWLHSQLDLALPMIEMTHMMSSQVNIENITDRIDHLFEVPEIEEIVLLSIKSRASGKSYQRNTETIAQPFLVEDSAESCRHGMKKKWCADCRTIEKREREKSNVPLDPFDLILPALYPPLGANFDNPVSFPVGKSLYPFQCEGVKFLVEHQNALLGDEMGLGKSIQTITALRLLFRLGKIKNCLLLCPKAVVTDWETKFEDWAPELRVQKVRGSQTEREIFWDTPAHVYLTTYESFREDLQAQTARTQVDICVLDEIQKIKNPDAKLSQAVRLVHSSWRWGLSGTPLENRIEDVVAIFYFLVPRLFSQERFLSPQLVRERINPYFLRRRKVEALPELPPKIHNEVWLELAQSQQRAYDRAEQQGIVELNEQGDRITVQHVFALITKLKQICNLDPVSQTGCKLEYLSERLEELAEQGDKALVFSQFPEKTLKVLAPQLNLYSPLSYDGSMSDQQRKFVVSKFQDEEENKVLLMSVKSGGVGITLTRASYVYHYDLWWNPSIAAQAEDRAHRIGQTKTVFVTSLYTRNTIEERIKKLLDQKRALFNIVIDELSDVDLTSLLTEEEIFGLFDLQKPRRSMAPSHIGNSLAKSVDLLAFTHEQFERLVSSLYEAMGYKVRVTRMSRDGGIDVYATKISDSGTERLVIQCKHYPNAKVSVEFVRALYGVMQADQNITQAVLVTSGDFTSDTLKFADGKRIELINGSRLIGLMEKYKVFA